MESTSPKKATVAKPILRPVTEEEKRFAQHIKDLNGVLFKWVVYYV